jgi:hypothetical protein
MFRNNWIEERCTICENQMMSTPYLGLGYCSTCHQYRPSEAPWAGQRWHGRWISERCTYCRQPILDTTDPSINYCPSCGRYQTDNIGY